MKFILTTVLTLHIFTAFAFTSTHMCHAQTAAAAPTPELADIIPMAGDLAGKLAQLENDLQLLPDASPVEKKYAAFTAEVDDITARLQQIKDSDERRWAQMADLSYQLQDSLALYGETGKPLAQRINLIGGLNKEWLAEKKRWQEWQSSLLVDPDSPLLKEAFTRAGETIDTALKIIGQHQDAMLQFQAQGSALRIRMEVLDAEIKAMTTASRRDRLLIGSPPMYSPEYLSQFRPELWQTTLENLRSLPLPKRHYFALHGWNLLAKCFIFLAVIFLIHRNREALGATEHWRFLAARPFASGFFVVVLSQVPFLKFQPLPVSLRLLAAVVTGISFIRILRYLVEDSWKRQATLFVVNLYVISMVLATISIPLPLARLYIVLVSLLAVVFLVRWSGESSRRDDSAVYAWAFRLGYILLGVIIAAQVVGKGGLAAYLFASMLTSLAITLAFALFIYMVRGALHWLFFSSPIWNIKQLRSDADILARRSGYLVEAFIIGFVLLPILLTTWGVYGSLPEAINGMLAVGFELGTERISVGLMLAAAGTLYGSLLLSWILPKVILDEKVAGGDMERGVRISVSRLIQYFIVFVGFLLTISVIGFDLTKITIILSALGVGIGFGLQGIVNNFISGLVLLFEQPVRVGDSIEVSGKWAQIKRIGLRSTTVQTVEKADVIIPNGDLISKEVTNWTLSNRQIRITIPVGVAYGSDVPLVMETLLACARDQEMAVKSLPPQVLFVRFGESTLDFELRVWITDADNRLQVVSDLHREIDRRFREKEIEIAFPQRDLHLRTVDKSIAMPSSPSA